MEEFKAGEYIVTLIDDGNCGRKNCCVKQRETHIDLRPVIDHKGNKTNGNSTFTKYDNCNWRYATPEEITEYERLGKPYDVTTLKVEDKPSKDKPFYVVVTEENITVLSKWRNSKHVKVGEIVGLCLDNKKLTKEHNPIGSTKSLSFTFGNEITFEQFLELYPEYKTEDKPKFIVGSWYKCSCNQNFYRYLTIKDNKYFVHDAVVNINNSNHGNAKPGYTEEYRDTSLLEYFKPDAIITDLSIIEKYLPVKSEPTKELTTLPEKWCIKITEENLLIVGKYYNRKGACAYTDIDKIGKYYASHNLSSGTSVMSETESYGSNFSMKTCESYTEITFNQFKQWVLKEPISDVLNVKDLIEGEIYRYDTHIVLEYPKGSCISTGDKYFTKSHTWNWCLKVTKATDEEKQWLRACIKANKFVSLEDSKKVSDVEKWSVGTYVLFIKDVSNSRSIGNIEKITDSYPDSVNLEKTSNCVKSRELDKEIKWFATKQEAEDFAKTLVEVKNDYQNLTELEVGDIVKCISEDNGKFGTSYGFKKDLQFTISKVDKYKANSVYWSNDFSKGVQSDVIRLVKKGSNSIPPPLQATSKVEPMVEEQWIPQVGDWITVIDDHLCPNTNGKTFQIKHLNDEKTLVTINNGKYDKRLLWIRKSGQEARKALPHEIPTSIVSTKETVSESPKFKIGDRVRIVKKVSSFDGYIWANCMNDTIGKEGEIISKSPNSFRVIIDGDIKWIYPTESLELVSLPKTDSIEDILAEAKRRFPVGCKFYPILKNGNFSPSIYDQNTECHIFHSDGEDWIIGSANIRNGKGDWAEIVSMPEPRIETKVFDTVSSIYTFLEESGPIPKVAYDSAMPYFTGNNVFQNELVWKVMRKKTTSKNEITVPEIPMIKPLLTV